MANFYVPQTIEATIQLSAGQLQEIIEWWCKNHPGSTFEHIPNGILVEAEDVADFIEIPIPAQVVRFAVQHGYYWQLTKPIVEVE